MRSVSAAVLVLALVLVLTLTPALAASLDDQCEEIYIPQCVDADLPYNLTRLPNSLGHTSQYEAGLAMHQFWPLVKIQCSVSLQPLLCLLYAPGCSSPPSARTLPCRELCQEARDGCEGLMNEYGFRWPEHLRCDRLPSAEAGERCAAPSGSNFTTPATPTPPAVTPESSPEPAVTPESSPEPAVTPESSPEPAVTAESSLGPSESPGPVCRCPGRSRASAPVLSDAATLDRALAGFLGRSERLYRLQEQNLQLGQQKLELEIQLLQRQLRSVPGQ